MAVRYLATVRVTPVKTDGRLCPQSHHRPWTREYVVGNVAVKIVSERVQYYSNDGKLITESLKDYSRKTILGQYRSLDAFLQQWTSAEQKQAVLTELESHGVFFEELAEQVGKDLDPFDLVCHVAFDQPSANASGTSGERQEEKLLRQVRRSRSGGARGLVGQVCRGGHRYDRDA